MLTFKETNKMANYLYSGVNWQCPCGGKGQIRGNSNVRISGKSMLTVANNPAPDLGSVCSLKQGAPCTPSGNWIKGTYSNTVKVQGKNALISTSKYMCSGMSLILSPQNCKAYENSNASYVDIKPVNISTKSKSDKYEKSDSVKAEKPEKNSDNTVNNKEKTVKSSENRNSDYNSKSELSVLDSSEMRKKRWCSGRCPEEYCNNCEFCNTDSSKLKNENSSSKLKNNILNSHKNVFETGCKLIQSIYCQLTPDYCINPTDTAHHIIPGNECLSKKNSSGKPEFELLIKIANFFDYDINCSENGIILPTFYDSQIMKSEQPDVYYDVMDKDVGNNPSVSSLGKEGLWVGSQLHIGSHSYENRLGKLKKMHSEYSLLTTYERIVIINYLIPFQNFYMNSYEKICFMKDKDKLCKDFNNRMNDISEKLRKYICCFPEHRISSNLRNKPYVSFPAMIYDLNISKEEYRNNYI